MGPTGPHSVGFERLGAAGVLVLRKRGKLTGRDTGSGMRGETEGPEKGAKRTADLPPALPQGGTREEELRSHSNRLESPATPSELREKPQLPVPHFWDKSACAHEREES